MGQTLGMEELDSAEVQISINDDDVDALSAEDILNLDDEQQQQQTDDIEAEEVEEIKELNLTDVTKIIEKLSEACDLATEADPNIERAIGLQQLIKRASQPYKQLQENLRNRSIKQKKMDDYISK